MTLFGFTFEWYAPGIRPNYIVPPFISVLRRPATKQWFAVWIGDYIRIGRK